MIISIAKDCYTSFMSSLYIPKEKFNDIPFLSRLLELHTPPNGVYMQGELPLITFDEMGRATPRVLTVVGSRKCTSYGKRVVESLLSSLSQDEVIIISGLALGIDGAAHTASLKSSLLTIAVPGSGLDDRILYPSSHLSLAKDILENGGALISELEDNERAAKWTFPARNRVMAALSDAVIIIEAEEESGTLITARLALELGRDIGAVPGDIFNPTAKGTLALIRDGATPVTSGDDLRELLHLPTKEHHTTTSLTLNQAEATIIELLREPKEKETLLEESGLTPTDFMMTITPLEMKGYIEETFGEVKKIV
jgi:DNA processing protein